MTQPRHIERTRAIVSATPLSTPQAIRHRYQIRDSGERSVSSRRRPSIDPGSSSKNDRKPIAKMKRARSALPERAQKSAMTYFPAVQYHRRLGLHCCVRDGNRCYPEPMVTDKPRWILSYPYAASVQATNRGSYGQNAAGINGQIKRHLTRPKPDQAESCEYHAALPVKCCARHGGW